MTPNPDPDEEADVRGANVGSRRRPAGAFNSTMMTTTMLTVCGFEDSTERAPPVRPPACMYVCMPPAVFDHAPPHCTQPLSAGKNFSLSSFVSQFLLSIQFSFCASTFLRRSYKQMFWLNRKKTNLLHNKSK